MNTKYKTLLTVLLIAASAHAQGAPDTLLVTPDQVFTPMGFDDNDMSEVVLYGEFPNTCYRVGELGADVNQDKKEIVIRNEALYFSGVFCAEMKVPYTRTVRLGMLRPGEYKVFVLDSQNQRVEMTSLPIAMSLNNGPDDFLYAPAKEAFIENPFSSMTPVLVLRGEFTRGCMSMKEVKVNVRPNHVIEVLPIAILPEGECNMPMKPFTVRVPLENIPKGKSLIHVRTLNGNALNQVFDFGVLQR